MSPASRRRLRRRLAGGCRCLLAALGTTGAAVALLAVTGLVTPLGVVSGSMAPAFRAGDLLLATPWPAERVAVGDVVVVANRRPDAPVVSHRVQAIVRIPGGAELTLKGDANAVPDQGSYPVGPWVRRVWLVLPGGAEVHALLTRPQLALPLLVVLGALAVPAVLVAPRPGPRHAAPRRPIAPVRRRTWEPVR